MYSTDYSDYQNIRRGIQTEFQPRGFRLSGSEHLWNMVTTRRIMGWLGDYETTVNQISRDSNTYGEFLFITLTRFEGLRQETITFWGMGYHDRRGVWKCEDWSFYESGHANKAVWSRQQAITEIEQSERWVLEAKARQRPRTAEQGLFAMLADLGDDDGAWSELS
jgi:hypothetical protein